MGAATPSKSTSVPASTVSIAPEANGVASTPVDGPSARPNKLINSPGETGPGRKLAALRTERTKVVDEVPLMVKVTARFWVGIVLSVGVTVMMPAY